MSILDKFFNKQKINTNAPDYNKALTTLFTSYLTNTYAKYVSNGNTGFKYDFTTMAQSQPLTFAQYCNAINSNQPVLSPNVFNPEMFQAQLALNVLQNNMYNQTYLADCCNHISAVYECALATSESSMQKLTASGEDPNNAQLGFPNVDALKEGFLTEPTYSFTSKGFERQGQTTVESARETITELNQANDQIVPWALNIISDGTKTATQNICENLSNFTLPEVQ